MNIHFIAIGGSAMHNLAIALHLKGYRISGSDDSIFEPSKSRLKKHGLLPEKTGWDAEIIKKDLDCVILGMHAKKDNPELLEAINKSIKIYQCQLLHNGYLLNQQMQTHVLQHLQLYP